MMVESLVRWSSFWCLIVLYINFTSSTHLSNQKSNIKSKIKSEFMISNNQLWDYEIMKLWNYEIWDVINWSISQTFPLFLLYLKRKRRRWDLKNKKLNMIKIEKWWPSLEIWLMEGLKPTNPQKAAGWNER